MREDDVGDNLYKGEANVWQGLLFLHYTYFWECGREADRSVLLRFMPIPVLPS
jgi:hypothetical protein